MVEYYLNITDGEIHPEIEADFVVAIKKTAKFIAEEEAAKSKVKVRRRKDGNVDGRTKKQTGLSKMDKGILNRQKLDNFNKFSLYSLCFTRTLRQ